jgi:hypothetical protein
MSTWHCSILQFDRLYDHDQAVTESSVGGIVTVAVVVNVKNSASAGNQTVTVQSTVRHFTEQSITCCTYKFPSQINIQSKPVKYSCATSYIT